MKNNTSLLFIGFVFLSLLLSSCDQSTKHRKLVVNNSDYDLVIFPGNGSADYFGYISDSIFVAKRSQVVIYDGIEISRLKDYKRCNTFTDTIRVKVVGHDSLKLTLDLNNKANWNYFVVRKDVGGGGSCECQIGIKDADIE